MSTSLRSRCWAVHPTPLTWLSAIRRTTESSVPGSVGLASPLGLLVLLLAWVALLLPATAWAQLCATPGKDGATFSATPNTYYPGVSASATSITVGSARTGTGAGATAIAANDLLLVIQMQAADINTANTSAYGAVSTTTNYTAGQYEYVTVKSVSGSVITTTTSLVNTYTTSTTTTAGTSVLRTFQVVRVPQYSTLTLGSNIVPPAWDGRTGGIIALDVAGNLNFNSFTINASGLGFRGGAGLKVSYSATTTPNTQNAGDTRYFTVANATPSLTLNAMKGEGIAGTPR
nr:hypothetical protein [Tanacetum cinerariifolium]